MRPIPLLERRIRARISKPSAALRGLPLGNAPPLLGHNLTRRREGGEVLVSSGDGRPLLARWQIGLGQVAAWTSDAGARWASPWAKRPWFPQLWAQLARATMRTRALHELPMRVSHAGTRAEIHIDGRAAGPQGRPLMGWAGTVSVDPVDPGRTPEPGASSPAAPGVATTKPDDAAPDDAAPDDAAPDDAASAAAAPEQPGRSRTHEVTEIEPGLYAATMDLPAQPGPYLVQARLSSVEAGQPADERGRAEARTGLAVRFTPERAHLMSGADGGQLGANILPLARVLTGGRALERAAPWPTGAVHRQRGGEARRLPLAPWILGAAVILFVVAVALRRATVRTPLRQDDAAEAS